MAPEAEWDHAVQEAAAWVRDFAEPCYGPDGAAKLLVSETVPVRIRSGALALREADPAHPLSTPYVQLGTRVQAGFGDGGTTAVLLCAGIVEKAMQAESRGLRRGTILTGLQTAHRQARTVLASLAKPCDAATTLATVGPKEWAGLVALEAPRLARAGNLDLDAIEIKGHRRGPIWLDGVLADGAEARERTGAGRILLLERGWKVKPDADIVVGDARGALAWESARRARLLNHLRNLGVQVVVVAGALDDDVRGVLAARGFVWTNASKSTLKRLAASTRATLVSRPEDATAADVGNATWRKERDGWILAGTGPSATLLLPGSTQSARKEAEQVGEKLLRAAGALLADSRGVPGHGAWQRHVGAALRRGADAAPGQSGLAWTAAADALDGLVAALVRNAGLDPLDRPQLAPATDGYPWAKAALDGAFETATSILRLDGIFQRQASSADVLRGGGTPKTAREMAGDIPPDM